VILLIAGAELVSSFILSNSVPVYLSIYVCMQSRQMLRLLESMTYGACWLGVSKIAYDQTAGALKIYFPAHCAGVANKFLHYNLAPV